MIFAFFAIARKDFFARMHPRKKGAALNRVRHPFD